MMGYRIQKIIDEVLAEIPGAPIEDTVDTLKAGDPSAPVTGIVTTFIATLDVLHKAVELGANFIITHEPTYYSHLDQTSWLAGDPVFAAKRQFIEEHGLTIWRFHDYWHMHQPDGIETGFVQLVGWRDYCKAGLFHLPPVRLGDLADFLKQRLGIPRLRIVGPMDWTLEKVALQLGSPPGELMISDMNKAGADVVVCGEASEWQVYEYVRDANLAGLPKGLIVLGHERSEEPGMLSLAGWLQERYRDLTITHVSAGDPLEIR